MRNIKYIVFHCTATSQNTTVAQLKKEFRRRGWKAPGYHYVVSPNGATSCLLPENKVANGVRGHNAESIHVAYIGGISMKTGKPVDNRTLGQKHALRVWAKFLKEKYPAAEVVGHRDLSPDLNGDGVISPNEWVKVCPCFDAKKEYN